MIEIDITKFTTSIHIEHWDDNVPDWKFKRLKASFRVTDYQMIKGKSMIREAKINELLNE